MKMDINKTDTKNSPKIYQKNLFKIDNKKTYIRLGFRNLSSIYNKKPKKSGLGYGSPSLASK